MQRDIALCCLDVVFLQVHVKTAQGYIALHSGVPLGKLQFNPTIITEAQWQRGLDEVIKPRMLSPCVWCRSYASSRASVDLPMPLPAVSSVTSPFLSP